MIRIRSPRAAYSFAHRCPLVMLSALAACNLLAFDGDCTAELRPMIIATVRDSRTSAAPLQPVTIVAYNSTARDSVTHQAPQPGSPPRAINLYPRVLGAGTYSVEVRANGYEPWRRIGVHVGENHCGQTNAARLNVSLKPL